MQKELAFVLKQQLVGLSFIDQLAGIVQPVIDQKFVDNDEEKNSITNKIVKRMPVSYDLIGGKDKYLGSERQLVPNESKKSIIYFEDFGTTVDTGKNVSTRVTAYNANIRLVCWLNKRKLNEDKYNELTAFCITEITKRLVKGKAINMLGITRLFLTVSRIPIQDAQIFSRYNYDEAELQYLRPPFEYFAIDFNARFATIGNCLPAKISTT